MKLRQAISTLVMMVLAACIVLAPARMAWAETTAIHNGAPELETPAAEKTDLEENLGFPQLKTDTYASQVFWLFVSFAILYPLMAWLALPSVGRVLDKRKRQREDDLSRAQKLGEEAEKIKSAYERSLTKAQRAAAEALGAAERAISDKISEAQSLFAAESRKRMAEADQAIEKAKAEALQSLADISAQVAADMVQKVANVQISTIDAKKAVDSVLQERKGAA